jgi:hypothetical protein
MSHLIFESQVKALMRQGVPREYAVLSASSHMEDKTLFYQTLNKMKEENDVIQEQLELSGFKLSTYKEVEDVPTNNQIQDIQHNLTELNEDKRNDE